VGTSPDSLRDRCGEDRSHINIFKPTLRWDAIRRWGCRKHALLDPLRTGVPGTSFYHGFVTLEPTSDGGTTITWEAQLCSPLPGAGTITSATLRSLVNGLATASEQTPVAG
jgi:hypothetical protein